MTDDAEVAPVRDAADPDSRAARVPNIAALARSLPAVLTVDEVALLLRVNRKTVYEGLHSGEIPGARRVGRIIRVGRDALIQWLAQPNQGRVSHSRRSR